MKTYTTLQAIGDIIVIYLIVIVVSMLVAAVIRGIVIVLSRQAEKEAAKAPAKPAAPVARPAAVAVGGVPQEHLAVIAAAVAAMMGTHRIVRIETPERGFGWTSEARSSHHTSHAPRASH